jgi:hypothetical protein
MAARELISRRVAVPEAVLADEDTDLLTLLDTPLDTVDA